ncbi:hypothetical protein PMAYCL1PPCAC_12863, partial [Pristionchus mayeri]
PPCDSSSSSWFLSCSQSPLPLLSSPLEDRMQRALVLPRGRFSAVQQPLASASPCATRSPRMRAKRCFPCFLYAPALGRAQMQPTTIALATRSRAISFNDKEWIQ